MRRHIFIVTMLCICYAAMPGPVHVYATEVSENEEDATESTSESDSDRATVDTLVITTEDVTESTSESDSDGATEDTSVITPEDTTQSTREETSPTVWVTPRWIKKKGNYYYQQSDGSILNGAGIVEIDGYRYYLGDDGRRLSGLRKADGKWYYFNPKNGRLVKKAGWLKLKGKKYYIQKGGALATGVRKIGKVRYGFTGSGKLRGFSRPFKYEGKWYRTNKKGVAESLTSMQVKCSKLTCKYINRYTSSKMSKKKKFRRLYNKLLIANFDPEYIKRRETRSKAFPYRTAYKVLSNNGRHNCYGFACTIASIAKELGYEPYVIVMNYDHAVVMINGRYYDNMGGRFGTKTPAIRNYKVYKKFKF